MQRSVACLRDLPPAKDASTKASVPSTLSVAVVFALRYTTRRYLILAATAVH